MNSKLHRLETAGKTNRAFTLMELLVIVAVLALLAVMLLPALASNQAGSQSFRCLNNQRQLILALRVYAEDNNDFLAGNDFPWLSSLASIPPIARANWAPGSMIVSGGDSTNVANLKNPAISQLFNYLKTADVFKCPADNSVYVRSVSMNSAVGTRWTYSDNGYVPPSGVQRGSQPVQGGWLPGGGYLASQTTWLTYAKFSSIVRPAPAGLFVIMDEHPDSINDSIANVPAVSGSLIDYPGTYHDGAAGVVFADGHAEMHRWQDPRTKPPIGTPLHNFSTPNNVDTVWLGMRVSARR